MIQFQTTDEKLIRIKYKMVMKELLEEHIEIPNDNVCECCGIVSIHDNSCDWCHMGVCYVCDDKINDKIYNSWLNSSYGYILCPSCYSEYRKKYIK